MIYEYGLASYDSTKISYSCVKQGDVLSASIFTMRDIQERSYMYYGIWPYYLKFCPLLRIYNNLFWNFLS